MAKLEVVPEIGDTVGYQGIAAHVLAIDGEYKIRMVGDDRKFWVSRDEITLIGLDDFCSGCGQIGCEHGG